MKRKEYGYLDKPPALIKSINESLIKSGKVKAAIKIAKKLPYIKVENEHKQIPDVTLDRNMYKKQNKRVK